MLAALTKSQDVAGEAADETIVAMQCLIYGLQSIIS